MKRVCLGKTAEEKAKGVSVPPPLVSAIEEGYNDLYLVKPGSLRASFEKGLPPPRKDSYVQLVKALSQVPRAGANIDYQVKRVDSYRENGVQVISIDEERNELI